MIAANHKVRGAVIVTRVSTGEQAKHGTSLESQLEACRAKAQAICLPIVAEYEDAGVSGGMLLTRDGMLNALRDIKEGRANTLICANMSRYSRDVEHQQKIRKDVRLAGGNVVFCDMAFDDTPEGDLAFSIMGGFAEYERKVIRARTMRGKRKRAEEGQQPSRSRAPFGYAIPTKADILRGVYPPEMLGQYVVIREKAEIVRRIFQNYADGLHSLPSLARALNSEGIPTPGGAKFWQATTLRSILTNTVYKGEAASGKWRSITDEARIGEPHPINGVAITRAHTQVPTNRAEWIILQAPAIVETDVWNRVAERLQRNRGNWGGNPNRIKMLSGRIHCPYCGGKAIAHNSSTRGKTYEYYVCKTYLTLRDKTSEPVCQGTAYRQSTVEQAVLDAIIGASDTPQAVTAAIAAYNERQQPSSIVAERKSLASIDKQLVDLDEQENATVKAQIDGIRAGASPRAYQAIFEEIASKRRDLTSKRQQLIRSEPKEINRNKVCGTRHSVDSILSDVRRVLTSSNISDSEKRSLIGTIIDRVVCQRDGADVYFLPSIYAQDTLQSILTTSSNSVGDRSIRP